MFAKLIIITKIEEKTAPRLLNIGTRTSYCLVEILDSEIKQRGSAGDFRYLKVEGRIFNIATP